MSNALSLVAYIPDYRVMIYYQYLYGATDFDGQGKTTKIIITYLLLLETINIIKC